tara:strand:+ start:71 stop:202 length:132 start_codon:yes stop_codon:yes gene_type:complete
MAQYHFPILKILPVSIVPRKKNKLPHTNLTAISRQNAVAYPTL